MTLVNNPFTQFFERSGAPLANGQIFIGTAGLDAQSNPIPVYWDESFTIPAPQPIRTLNGYPVWNGAPAKMFVNAADFSITVRDARNVLILSSLSDFSTSTGNSIANVLDYGATGTGIADDTTAFIAAAATGKIVYAPSGTYRLTSGITLSTNGQRFYGDGEEETIIVPVGDFDVVTLASGVEHCGVERMTFNAIGMTGGYIVNVNGADRVYCAHLRINNPWNSFRVYRNNVSTFFQIYGQRPRGPYAWYCQAPTEVERSDVIRLQNVNYGGLINSRIWTGFYSDGPVNTIQMLGVTFVNPLRGIHSTNTGSGSDPQFWFIHDLEVDFPQNETARLEVGRGYFFTSLYAQGSASSAGFYVGPDTTTLSISNGFVTGNNREGIIIEGDDVSLSNVQVTFNGVPANWANYDGIRITGTGSRINITGSQFGQREGLGSAARYGVSVENGARSIRVSNCTFDGCAFGDVLDNSGITNPNNVEITGSGANDQFFNERISGFEMGVASGSGATVSPIISAGVITGTTALVGGINYENAPSVIAFDPSGAGSGFVATATVSAGSVTGITITNGGSNYGANTVIVIRPVTISPTIRAAWPGLQNQSLRLRGKGTGSVTLGNANGIGFVAETLDVSSVNYLQARGRAAGATPDIIAVGSDPNIDIGIIPKGTGRVRLGGPIAATAGGISTYLEIQVGATVYKLPLYGV